MQRLFITLLLGICSSAILHARVEENEKVGNFLLPTSQQAAPLFGFGQNIVDKYDKQVFLDVNLLKGCNNELNILSPGFIYGIQDDLALCLFFPYTLTAHEGHHWSSGINDFVVQLEYAFLTYKTEKTATQATVIGSIIFPTGSFTKNPHLGLGSIGFFTGCTVNYTTQWWAVWIQGGVIVTTQHKHTKCGNSYFYQAGVERCFATYHGWMYAGMVELFGQSVEKDIVHNVIDANTGGNSLWLGPSLMASSDTYVFQGGVAFPLVQRLNGAQKGYNSYVNIIAAYKF